MAGHTRIPQAAGGAVQLTLPHQTPSCEAPQSKRKRENNRGMLSILSLFLPQLLSQTQGLYRGKERLSVKHALFTQTPLLPSGRLRKGQTRGARGGGKRGGLCRSLWLP